MHRVSRFFAPSFALIAFVVITVASTRAEAQRSRVRGPRFGQRGVLGVVREYDGPPGSTTVAMVRAPLDIVRNYDTAEGTAGGAHDALIPMAIAPWDGPATIEVTSAVPTTAVAATRDEMNVLPRLPLVAFDGSEMTLTPLDASVRSLSVITDYDADATTGAGGSVRVTYDASGSVVHVETALPALPVASSAPPSRRP
jgi:hypothetical protein